jgi:manganese oxidase
MERKHPQRIFCLATVGVLLGLVPAGAAAQTCPEDGGTVIARVVALNVPTLFYNRLGANLPKAMMFALERDVCAPSKTQKMKNGQLLCEPDVAPTAGNVILKPYKRPRPLALRVNRGQCLQIEFTNLLGPAPTSCTSSNSNCTTAAGVHVQGLEWVSGPQDDGSWVGNNATSLVAPGKKKSPPYLLYAPHEGTYLLYSAADNFSGNPDGGQLQQGLFGAVHVEVEGAESYRSQVTAEDLEAAAAKLVPYSPTSPKLSPYGQPEINYQAVYGNTTADPCFKEGLCRVGPVLNMLCTFEAAQQGACELNEIVHSDLTAIISGPDAGRFVAGEEEPVILQSSYPLPDRLQPYREFTIIYHEAILATQAFSSLYNSSALKKVLPPGGDFFGINYGMGGIGSEILANRLGVGPMANCPTCKYEEFFLTSWTVGDPAMVVDKPASNQCSSTAGTCSNGTACNPSASTSTCPNTGVCSPTCKTTADNRATRAFHPDDPSNVYHSYISDHTVFRILHGGADLHHLHHQHAHQWLHSPDTANGDYTDSQSIGPGSSFTLEMVFNGSGNVNQTPGDSIFHCHFYPHFAGGMWSMWRVHDVYETGTELDDAGRPVTSVIPGGARVTTTRALPDGEIVTGTPIPAVVPVPTIPMPLMPAQIQLTHDGTQVSVCNTSASGTTECLSNLLPADEEANPAAWRSPGFPFYIPGLGGQRAPHPPMDFAYACSDNSEACTPALWGKPANLSACQNPQTAACEPLNGGLPRHLVKACAGDDPEECATVPPVNPTDFSKTLEEIDAFQLPEEGTFIEQVAMAAQSVRLVDSVTPTGETETVNGYDPGSHSQNMRPAQFILNGLPPVPGAPFADPCINYSLYGGVPIGLQTRSYKAADLQLDVSFNKEGWHYPQERILTLWGDVQPTLTGQRPPEPLFFRANSGECIEYTLANLVPNVYELDDFQVRTPTDILGQHIHLVKFDVTSSDGATNGFNYEDGTFAPNEVMERIAAINNGGGLSPSFSGGTKQPLQAEVLPFFGPGPGGQWVGAQATIQRWFADPVFDGTLQQPGLDRTLRTVFTHDHFGPSTHQQAGLYAGLVVEPEGSNWYFNEKPSDYPAHPFGGVDASGRPLPGRVATGQGGLEVLDGGPTTWQAVIVTPDPKESFREFMVEMQDSALLYQAFDSFSTTPPAPSGFCSDTGSACTPATASQPASGCNPGAVCYAYGFCSNGLTQKCTPDTVANYVCGHCTNGKCSNNGQLSCGSTSSVVATCATNASCNLVVGIPGTAIANTTTPAPSSWGTTPINAPGGSVVELVTLGGATNNFLFNYRSEPLFQRVNSSGTAANVTDLSFAYSSIDRGSLRGQCSTSKAACTQTSQCPSGQTCNLGGFLPQTNAYCSPAGPGCGPFPYPTTPLTADIQPGDPFTPLLRAYAGDDVQVRVLTGAHINPHNFTIHGVKWLMEPSFVDSGWRSSQVMGISEHFEQVFQMPPSFTGGPGTPKTDYLVLGGAAAIEQAGGNWALMRAYNSQQGDLLAVPNNQTLPPKIAVCDPDAPNPRTYSVVATTVKQATGGSLIYNQQGSSIIAQDQKAILYVNLNDLKASDGTSPCTSAFQSCKLPAGTSPQPLVLRAAAGDCLQVTLYNAIQATNLGAGATSPVPLAGSSTAPVTLTSNTSPSVGLHPQLVTFDSGVSNGFNAGVNPTQTVAAGSGSCPANANAGVNCATYTWYAGNISPKAKKPYIPIEFGAANLLASDPLNHYQYGLFGALVIEPPGATCGGEALEKCTGVSAVIQTPERSFREFVLAFQDGLPTLWQLPSTTVGAPTLGGGNMEAVNYKTEMLALSLGNPTLMRKCANTTDLSCALSTTAQCCTQLQSGTNKPTCQTYGACAPLQTPTFQACAGEEVRFRVVHPGGINTNQVFELFGHTFSESPFMSRGVGCLTPTTHTNLYSSSEIGIFNECAVKAHDPATLALDKAVLDRIQLNFSNRGTSKESLNEWQGSHMGHGPQNHWDVLVESAGGVNKVPGDYLYRSYVADHFRLGPWGIFQVLGSSDAQTAGLACIGPN